MEAPSPQYILSRAAWLITLLVAVLVSYSFIKKKQRQAAITAELESITSDSSFFQQFYPDDARKSLVKAIGLIAEANSLGVDPDTAINRGMGLKAKFFENDAAHEAQPIRETIIYSCLRNNYENFIKLGYKADFHTLEAMRAGELPPIPGGPQAGRQAVISTLISAALSPGLDKVIANLEIRPPQADAQAPNVIEIAAAKKLAHDLAEARLIEEAARDRILQGLSGKPTP